MTAIVRQAHGRNSIGADFERDPEFVGSVIEPNARSALVIDNDLGARMIIAVVHREARLPVVIHVDFRALLAGRVEHHEFRRGYGPSRSRTLGRGLFLCDRRCGRHGP